MLKFMGMAGNYNDRVVGRSDQAWGFVSTARVNDGRDPFETAIKHSGYARVFDGATDKLCIVESYAAKELAAAGHDKWVTAMLADNVQELKDCCNSELERMRDEYFEPDDDAEDLAASRTWKRIK